MRHDESNDFGRFVGRAIEKTQVDADNTTETEGRLPVNGSSVNR